MNDTQAVLTTMALAMVQVMEEATVTGRSFVVSFAVEGGTGRIAPIVEETPALWDRTRVPSEPFGPDRMVMDYKP